MNRTPNVRALTIKAPDDVRQKLEEWAAQNCSSMTTELVRSVRERAQREQREDGGLMGTAIALSNSFTDLAERILRKRPDKLAGSE